MLIAQDSSEAGILMLQVVTIIVQQQATLLLIAGYIAMSLQIHIMLLYITRRPSMTKAAELAKMGEVLTNSQIGGRRNIVINGAMQVAQRGTSQLD